MRHHSAAKQNLILVLVLLLSACSHYSPAPGNYGYYPQQGSKITIVKDIRVEAGRAGLYLQNGVNQDGKHNRLRPYCYIRFRNLNDAPRYIKPGNFVVRNSGIQTRIVNHLDWGGPRFILASHNDKSPSDVAVVISMDIYSPRQPDVYLLECGGAEDHPADAQMPTLAEMQSAVGDYIRFGPLK